MKSKTYNVLLLSNYPENIKKSIERYGDNVDIFNGQLNKEFIEKYNYDYVISFGYRFLIKDSVLKAVKEGSYNLHIGYLPYNKGAHPNFWSNIESTPSGVTIHTIDNGIDTGKILFQKEIIIDKKLHSFSSSYTLLINEIERLFDMNWCYLRENKFDGWPQKEGGTLHYKRDLDKYKNLLTNGWETNINAFLKSLNNKLG